jgi:hypothetical protein
VHGHQYHGVRVLVVVVEVRIERNLIQETVDTVCLPFPSCIEILLPLSSGRSRTCRILVSVFRLQRRCSPSPPAGVIDLVSAVPRSGAHCLHHIGKELMRAADAKSDILRRDGIPRKGCAPSLRQAKALSRLAWPCRGGHVVDAGKPHVVEGLASTWR